MLVTGAQQLGIELTAGDVELFMRYAGELKQWNQRINLTAITEDSEIVVKHFLDSLACCMIEDLKYVNELIDVGTGAGFPGIPLKILFRDIHLTLMDSVKKKTAFLRHILEYLGIDAKVLDTRAEEVGQNPKHREQYDAAVSRAVASMSVLAEYCLPLVRTGGFAVFLKGMDIQDEINEARNAIESCGGKMAEVIPLTLPYDGGKRNLIVVKKVAATPEIYPRRPGIPTKKPIK